jgi:hypothetical protein
MVGKMEASPVAFGWAMTTVYNEEVDTEATTLVPEY